MKAYTLLRSVPVGLPRLELLGRHGLLGGHTHGLLGEYGHLDSISNGFNLDWDVGWAMGMDMDMGFWLEMGFLRVFLMASIRIGMLVGHEHGLLGGPYELLDNIFN